MNVSFKKAIVVVMMFMGVTVFVKPSAVIAQSCGEADAGEDMVVLENIVLQLDGSSTFTDPVSYHWEQTAGSPIVTLSDPDIANPTFTTPNADADGIVLTFQLTVTAISGGCEGESATDEVIIIVAEIQQVEEYEEDDKFCFINAIQ